MAKVEFNFEGEKIDVQCNEKDKMDKILRKFCVKAQKNIEDLCFLYGGKLVNNNLDFISIANSIDKQRKIISIVVTDNSKDNNSELIKENKELKEKLIKANKALAEKDAEIEDLKYKITMIKSESVNQVNNLMNTIEKKDEQIKNLKKKLDSLNKTDVPKKKKGMGETISISFMSADQIIFNYSIPCTGNTIFSEIEEKLYKEYPEYRESENSFLHHGTIIKRFKTINENKIKSGDKVMVLRNDDY